MNYGRKITKLRKNLNITQEELAKQVGISRTALAHYEKNRREPDYGVLCKLADFFDVSVDYILGRSRNKEINKAKKIPLLDEITPETALLAKNYKKSFEEIFNNFIEIPPQFEADFAFMIDNSSMSWAGINKGDIALIKTENTPSQGKMIAVAKKKNDFTGGIKFCVQENNTHYLKAANPKYQDIVLSDKFVILGSVILVFKKPPTYREYKNFLFEKTKEDKSWQKAKEKSASYGLNGETVNTLLDMAEKLRKLDKNID